jgi:hypothetical protein
MFALIMLADARPSAASSAPGWITLAIALAGLVLSIAGLYWQAYTFIRSGSRIRVQTRWAWFISFEDEPEKSYLHFLDTPVHWPDFALRDFERLTIVAVIQNTGRLPVTVRNCQWHFKGKDISGWLSAGRPPVSAEMPCRLDAHDECMGAMEYSILGKMLAPSGVKQVYPRVELANGRTAQGTPLEIPDPPVDWKPLRESNLDEPPPSS